MDRKITVIVVILFISIAVIVAFGRDILERANPSPPKLLDVELSRGIFSEPETDGTYYVQGNILSDCSVAFTYVLPEPGKVEVYELDGETYKAITGNQTDLECSGKLVEGTLKIRFDQTMEFLSIQIWNGRLSDDGSHVYFQLLGTWQFFGNLSAVYVEPSPEKDYKLTTLPDLEDIVNSNGIHPLTPSLP